MNQIRSWAWYINYSENICHCNVDEIRGNKWGNKTFKILHHIYIALKSLGNLKYHYTYTDPIMEYSCAMGVTFTEIINANEIKTIN